MDTLSYAQASKALRATRSRKRRAGYTLNTPTTATSAGTETEASVRVMLAVPVATKRWRLRVRNWQPRSSAVYTGVINFTGVWVGEPAFTTGTGSQAGRPSGAFTATPVAALSAFATASDGSEYVSAWVTADDAQFQPDKPHLLSYGFTKSAGSVAKSLGAYSFISNTVGTAAAGVAGAAALPSGMGVSNQFGYFDLWIEYEWTGSEDTGFVMGDSLSAGFGQGTTSNYVQPIQSGNDPTQIWPHRYAMLHKTPVTLAASSGFQLGEPLTSGHGIYARLAALAADGFAPDFAIVMLGSNDFSGNQGWSVTNGYAATVTGILRGYGIERVYFLTVPVRIQLGGVAGADEVPAGALTSAAASGTAQIITDVPFPTNTRLTIDSGLATAENVWATSASTGTGPYTTPVTSASSVGTPQNMAQNHAVGAKVFAYSEDLRRTMNQGILRGAHGATGSIDIARALADPLNPFQLDAAYRAIDKVHLTAAGHGVIAGSLPRLGR